MKTKLLVALLACLASTALIAADSPSVGSTAPDISVTDSKGKTVEAAATSDWIRALLNS